MDVKLVKEKKLLYLTTRKTRLMPDVGDFLALTYIDIRGVYYGIWLCDASCIFKQQNAGLKTNYLNYL